MNFIDRSLKKIKRGKVYSSFKDNILGVDLAHRQSVSKYNRGIKYLFCAIDLISKYASVVPLKDKRVITIVNAFQKILDSSKSSKAKSKWRKPNKIWVDQGGEFYNKFFKRFLKTYNIEMYSNFNEGKSIVVDRFLRTLKSIIYEHLIGISKNVYFDVLDDFVKKYNNTVHRTTKMKPTDVKSHSNAQHNEYSNEKDPKFKFGDHVRIQNTETFLLKDILQIGLNKFLLLAKLKYSSMDFCY